MPIYATLSAVPLHPSLDVRSSISDRLAAARIDGELFIEATYGRACPVCGAAAMIQEGVLATGLALELYTPEVGEVLKNRWMVCEACGFEQAS